MSRRPVQESSALTHSRRELKFKLSEANASAFAAQVSARIPKHRFQGHGANRLPRARHYVTSVYFDTAARDVYRAVVEDPDSLKIRAREYYDLHPELLELANNPRDIVRYSPVLWLEIKGKQGGRTYKRRIGIPKGDVSPFFEHGLVSQALRDLQRARPLADDVIAELLALRARFGEPLRASCLVNYRRTAFEDPAGTLRITFDQHLACFRAPATLWQNTQPLVREALGTPAFEESACVLELKAHGELPGWLSELLEQTGAEERAFSKFVTASEAVFGPLTAADRARAPESS